MFKKKALMTRGALCFSDIPAGPERGGCARISVSPHVYRSVRLHTLLAAGSGIRKGGVHALAALIALDLFAVAIFFLRVLYIHT